MIKLKIRCTKCRRPKPLDQFYRSGRRCKECVKAASRAYRAANELRVKEAQRARYSKNRQTYIDRALERYDRLRPQILEQTAARNRRYRKEKIAIIIRERIGKRLARILRGRPCKGWREEFGYDPGLIVPHLEAQFESWMTWENYGTAWHIDHRRPVSSFKLPEQIRECWALSNLQPLEARANLKKGARWANAA